MTPEKLVLVALDGSREATRAIPLARAIAAQLHARPVAVFVAAESLPPDADARVLAGLDREQMNDLRLVVRTGDPAAALLAELDAAGADVLVMTASAAGKPVRGLGRVAMNVIVNATKPVVVVRPEAAPAPGTEEASLERLLVPLDGKVETAAALQGVTTFARQLGASVEIIYVAQASAPTGEQRSVAGRRYVDQPQHEWQSWSHEVKEHLLVETAGFSPSAHIPVHLRQGEPGGEIARFASHGHFDAIVLARSSRMEPDRAEVMRIVIERSPCPLIVIGYSG